MRPGRPESFEEKLARVLSERIEVVEYDPAWPEVFAAEAARLRPFFPPGCIVRLEHIGSTAVPGLAAKPVVDILVGVDDVELVRDEVAPRLEAAGYDYFWRPTSGDDTGPFYPWFIGRDAAGRRISHIHVAPLDMSGQWERVEFRDHLRAHPDVAAEYAALKRGLAERLGHDREAYTDAKTEFILRVTALATRRPAG